MIPEWLENGDLPPGVHFSQWAEVEDRLAFNPLRRRLFAGFREACDLLRRAGCRLVYLDGSFVTTKPLPGDFDACWDIQHVDEDALDPVFWDFSQGRAAQKRRFLGEFFPAQLPEGATHVFFLVDGRRNPIDQIEAFKPWLEAQGAEIGRVISVVHTQLAEKHPALLAWFEACVHFSDVVLLNRREGVGNKALSDFLNHFKKQYYPCHFELLKDNHVKNPALVLEPQARRMSHVFDEEQDWVFTNSEGEEIDEQEDSDDEEIEAKPEEDPYFARRNGGRRLKEIPEIADFL